MKHRYVVGIPGPGTRNKEMDLAEETFLSLKGASKRLSAGLDLEMKFDVLVSNYLEFEKELLQHSTEFMIRFPSGVSDSFGVHIGMNRRLVNLLTTARLYVDHAKHHVNEIIGKDQQPIINGWFSDQYDARFEYRFMEAMRNFVQHRGFPVHTIQFRCDWNGEADKRRMLFTIEVGALKEMLTEANGFKAAPLAESTNHTDLKSAARVYVECFGSVHARIREAITSPLRGARECLERVVHEYELRFPGKPTILQALQVNDQGDRFDHIPVLLSWDDIRLRLVDRNHDFENLSRRYVSSELNLEFPSESRLDGGLLG